ncbi:ABC transporter ATP-binding protein [Heyndrickxia sporothermodurans]|uniref:ABC transporter ATP-binding protein n=2 Tax=Heyndrickxia sporothermodurans TaxID=46224 RepID=A0AB37HBV5_9BACI|nr:ABC transporter ATP-binding protein [Heyndrickxia sporothermodurans]MBL5771734.1 ABC transporter ATP-binding protein [Heyndrickxia sporothermodurans]MBL5775346.1 ABC transporter ATP-binding protein [Heyndrickxia sporothermodurans]MBL5778835.1 ABC transporter ATP-binding protein [Heyndrickxia sporothermodurans]MBL5781958.1 ABC transporter ATP-binding protein [Heyndrickxia sporothermodurans]MBL5786003.1 ABC transporter ATP-binding protein [Heyndrickxia sporothermodurans]
MRGHGGRGGPVVKPKNFKGTLKRLWHYFGNERKILSIIFLFILIDSVITLSAPYLIGKSIDAMTIGGKVDFNLLEVLVLVLLFAYITDAFLTFLQSWLMAGVSQRIVKRLRSSLFKKLQKLPVSFFDTRTHGELMSRLSNDIDNVSNTISQSTTQLMSGGIVLLGSLIMMLILSPILTLATLITVPLVFLLTKTIAKKTRILFKNQQIQLGKLNGHIEETISGIQVVKAFNHEDKAIEEFEEVNTKLKQVGLKAQIWSGFLMPLMNVISNLGFAIVAIVGGLLAVKSLITIGVIASFLTYSRQFGRPLNDLANIFNVLQSGVAGAERVFEILDEKEEIEDQAEAITLTNPKGNVHFENVSFGYRPDVPILKNVRFEAEIGSSTAFVGPTGAGKTTIVNLLTRFYDVTEGHIYLDGKDIREYTRDSLRKCFGIVLQDTYLFSGTIKENIKYGKPDATDEEVIAAARMANADLFIKKLPNQYETMLSENGGNLSQGQRQLLAIARVMLARPALLILDEATSSIDTRTELHIQDALLKVMNGRTSFIIAHRLNTVREADTIMVIDHGEIVEKGSHDELIGKRGVYYNMFFNQFKNVEGV